MIDNRFFWLRAFVIYVAAYAAVTVVATAFSIGVVMAMHVTGVASPMDNPGYQMSERFLPLINLVVWGAFAALYFAKRDAIPTRAHAWKLGALWLALALPTDFLLFVLTPTPISLSPYDFYVRQFPWIYLIYLVVLVSPLCWVTLRNSLSRRPA